MSIEGLKLALRGYRAANTTTQLTTAIRRIEERALPDVIGLLLENHDRLGRMLAADAAQEQAPAPDYQLAVICDAADLLEDEAERHDTFGNNSSAEACRDKAHLLRRLALGQASAMPDPIPVPVPYREAEIIQWGIARNLIGPTGEATRVGQHAKTEEEVAELLDAIATRPWATPGLCR